MKGIALIFKGMCTYAYVQIYVSSWLIFNGGIANSPCQKHSQI